MNLMQFENLQDAAEVADIILDAGEPARMRKNLRELMDTWFINEQGYTADIIHSMYGTFHTLDKALEKAGTLTRQRG